MYTLCAVDNISLCPIFHWTHHWIQYINSSLWASVYLFFIFSRTHYSTLLCTHYQFIIGPSSFQSKSIVSSEGDYHCGMSGRSLWATTVKIKPFPTTNCQIYPTAFTSWIHVHSLSSSQTLYGLDAWSWTVRGGLCELISVASRN